MSQTIYLAAMVVREARLLLVRPAPDAPWELPGGPLLPEHDDVDAGMDAILTAMGVNAPAIEEDFVHTIFMSGTDGPLIYNIYAPSEWFGEPDVPEAAGSAWFALEEVEAIDMDDQVRSAVLEAYGMREPSDDTGDILSAVGNGFEPFKPGLRLVDTSEPAGMGNEEESRASAFRGLEDDLVAGLDRLTTSALDRRTRGLAVLAMLTVLRASHTDIRAQVEDTLDAGAGPDQVAETLRMAGIYAGFPAAREAWAVMEEVFVSRGITQSRSPR